MDVEVDALEGMHIAVGFCHVARGKHDFTLPAGFRKRAHWTSSLTGVTIQLFGLTSLMTPITETVLPQRVFNRSFPSTFALALLAKDTGIALDLVHQAKLPAPVLGLVQSLMRAASDTAEANSDFSASVKLLESWTGITLE